MTNHDDLEKLVVDGLDRGMRCTTPPGAPNTAETLATMRRRKTSALFASGAVGAALLLVLTMTIVNGRDPVSTPPPATSGEEQAPPCIHDWGDDWVDLEDVDAFVSIEEAVAARTGDGWKMRVGGVDTGGWTEVEVTDPWGRQGVYELAEIERGWYVASGSGCAPPQPPEASPISAQPCDGTWDEPDYTTLESSSTPEEAVRALTGDDWTLQVEGLDADGWMVVEVTDPWGREGRYYLDEHQDGWVAVAGRGCAPSEGQAR